MDVPQVAKEGIFRVAPGDTPRCELEGYGLCQGAAGGAALPSPHLRATLNGYWQSIIDFKRRLYRHSQGLLLSYPLSSNIG